MSFWFVVKSHKYWYINYIYFVTIPKRKCVLTALISTNDLCKYIMFCCCCCLGYLPTLLMRSVLLSFKCDKLIIIGLRSSGLFFDTVGRGERNRREAWTTKNANRLLWLIIRFQECSTCLCFFVICSIFRPMPFNNLSIELCVCVCVCCAIPITMNWKSKKEKHRFQHFSLDRCIFYTIIAMVSCRNWDYATRKTFVFDFHLE